MKLLISKCDSEKGILIYSKDKRVTSYKDI